jgi:sulfatase maturation enzyme AslB (radical SAM superfamily)
MSDEIKEEYMNHYIYLHNLKESGFNMFGAAPYLADEFFIPRSRAKQILLHWMQVYPKLKEEQIVQKEIERRTN